MSARAVPPAQDPIQPQPATAVEIEFEGRTYRGVLGQSIAGILLANDVLDWRTTSVAPGPTGTVLRHRHLFRLCGHRGRRLRRPRLPATGAWR